MSTPHHEAPLRARPSHRPPRAGLLPPGTHRIEPPATSQGRRPGWARIPTALAADRPVAVAVMLHGSGGEPQQGLELLEPHGSAAGLVVVAPASRDYTWDGILGRTGPDLDTIDHVLHWAFEHFLIDPARLTIGGFSDGASYALSVGLGHGDLFSRVLALSPGFVPTFTPTGQPRVFVSHGTRDSVLPIERCSRRIVPALVRARYQVDYREFDGAHVIPPAIAAAAVQWLQGGT